MLELDHLSRCRAAVLLRDCGRWSGAALQAARGRTVVTMPRKRNGFIPLGDVAEAVVTAVVQTNISRNLWVQRHIGYLLPRIAISCPIESVAPAPASPPARGVDSNSPSSFAEISLPARATPIPAARNQILNQSMHAIREPCRRGPLLVHRGANRLQPSSKSRASSLYALVNVSTCAFKIPCCSLMYLLHLTYPC